MQIDLMSIARHCYNVTKRRSFNVKIGRQSDVNNLRQKNVLRIMKIQISLTSIQDVLATLLKMTLLKRQNEASSKRLR